MFKKLKYQIVLMLAIIIGFIVIQSLLNSYQAGLKQDRIERLNKVHSDAVIRSHAGINVYAAIVSSIKAFFSNSDEFPTELEVQSFLRDLLQDLDFKGEILINYIDAGHTFRYVITPTEIDPAGLRGLNVKAIRPQHIIERLDELMQKDNIYLFQPLNLKEGWVGIPFNFSVKDSKGESLGYVTPIINIRYLLDYFYMSNSSNEFVHSFKVNDSIEITREVVYDDAHISNTKRDRQYFRNFDVDESEFIYSRINVYNLNLKVGSAYKLKPEINNTVALATYVWYALLSLFSFIALFQYIRSQRLTTELQIANTNIEKKNKVLETNIFKIQTLIKEIHHRVKNNMHMVANLLSLQEEKYEDPKIIDALKEAKNRIQSMSLIHEKLYGSENLQDVNTKQYINQLLGFVEDTISNESILPKRVINVSDSMTFDSQTMESLGLIINELITNSYKHAFKPEADNRLTISISEEDEIFTMIYIDSGSGLPDEFNLETSQSLGMQLIHILAGQLNGYVEYSNKTQSTFKIVFREAEDVHL